MLNRFKRFLKHKICVLKVVVVDRCCHDYYCVFEQVWLFFIIIIIIIC